MKTAEQLMELAYGARDFAYAPYSSFLVGAALEAESGRVYTGANVENASYGLSVCAERIAVFKAVNAGERSFCQLAVAAGSETAVFPCGACLQVLAEFAPEIKIILTSSGGICSFDLKELLPQAFALIRRQP